MIFNEAYFKNLSSRLNRKVYIGMLLFNSNKRRNKNMDTYNKEFLEQIRKLETQRASQKSKGLENTLKGSLDNAIIETNDYIPFSIVYDGE